MLKQKINAGKSPLLPMAAILETGNHIAQNGNGGRKRRTATLFVDQITFALKGASSFKPILFHNDSDIAKRPEKFPDFAMLSNSPSFHNS